jgi:hypothetical protein
MTTYRIGSTQLGPAETATGVAHAVDPDAHLREDAPALCNSDTLVRVARGTWPPRDDSKLVEPCNICLESAGEPCD